MTEEPHKTKAQQLVDKTPGGAATIGGVAAGATAGLGWFVSAFLNLQADVAKLQESRTFEYKIFEDKVEGFSKDLERIDARIQALESGGQKE